MLSQKIYRNELGLNESFHMRLWKWSGTALQGDPDDLRIQRFHEEPGFLESLDTMEPA